MRSTDRLTTMDKTGEIHPKGMREGKWKVCKNCTVYGEMAALIEQLWRYENTGLSPEQVEHLKAREKRR
ncbi:MAG: hypothetical protein LUD50_04575 [Clostridia bacterium]|nr:hypothetical protein [Clostridia bacterium]